MDRIQDKANKLINEVRKKKIKMSSIGTCKDQKDKGESDIRNVTDLSENTCLFCEKIFISSHYLMKHVYRRHAENLMKLHRKCLLSNSTSDFKSLFTFLEEEFLVLKNELRIVKQAIGHKIPRNEIKEKSDDSQESLEYVSHIKESRVCSDVADIDSREIDLLKEKVHNIESNIQCLHNKIEEFNSVMRTEILFRQDVLKHKVLQEESFLREQESQLVELRQVLLKELKSTLSKELSENDLKWKSKFAELKHDILKLDHVISSLKKQIDSPDYLTTVEKRLEQQIVSFLRTQSNSAVKRRNSRVRKKSSKGQRNSQNSKAFETNDCGKQITSSISEIVHFKPELESNKLHVSPEELSFLIAERLSHFNISRTTSKLSNTEYEEKLKLVNSVKESLSKKYHNFSEIYKNINLFADQRVFSKLKSKKSRKLRFSEPLIINEDRSFNLKPSETDILNKSYPVLENSKQLVHEFQKMSPSNIKNSTVLENQRFIIPTSERFSFLDVGGGGEFSGNFPEVYHSSVKKEFMHRPREEHETSTPNADNHNSEKTDCSCGKDSSLFGVYKNNDSGTVDIENASYHMIDDFGKQDMPFIKPFIIHGDAELKDSELDDFDKHSLKSLSSWDDEENSC